MYFICPTPRQLLSLPEISIDRFHTFLLHYQVFTHVESQAVDRKEYLVHLIPHRDCRFINHPSWLSVTFCLLQNQQINARSERLSMKKFSKVMSDQEIASSIHHDETDLMRNVFDHGSILTCGRLISVSDTNSIVMIVHLDA